jgi:hypothetical protein
MADHVGRRFAQAVADKDAAGLKALMQSSVDFGAMTPRQFWEATDIDTMVGETILGTWFAPERRITEVLGVETDRVGSVNRVGYRFTVQRPDGEFVIEQQAYFETDGDKISWLRILCSGLRPSS